MIPYIYLPTINLGFFSLSTWGLLAAIGFALGIFVFWKMGRKWGINPVRSYPNSSAKENFQVSTSFKETSNGVNGDKILDLSFWIMLGAIIGARLGHVFFYDWVFYRNNLNEIIAIWHGGMSLLGGLIGGGLCAIWKIKRYNLPVWRTLDALVFALPFGLGCGRIGCFLIHDHPGTLTHFILGVKYPDGVRHDLGLELLFVNIALGITFFILRRKERSAGFFLTLFLLLYPPIRFLLDFLRATDIRYAGLTPAQYGMMGLFVVGCVLIVKFPSLEGRGKGRVA